MRFRIAAAVAGCGWGVCTCENDAKEMIWSFNFFFVLFSYKNLYVFFFLVVFLFLLLYCKATKHCVHREFWRAAVWRKKWKMFVPSEKISGSQVEGDAHTHKKGTHWGACDEKKMLKRMKNEEHNNLITFTLLGVNRGNFHVLFIQKF